MIISTILWTIVLVIGLPMFLIGFSILLTRTGTEIVDSMDEPEIVELAPEMVPGVPTRKLRRRLSQMEENGYRQILGYTAPKSTRVGMTNYAFVLFSPSGKTYAEVFYIRAPILFRIVTFIFNFKNFHRFVLDVAFYSVWDNNSRLVTTPEKNVVTNILDTDVSQVMPKADLLTLIEAHERKLSELERERQCCIFTSVSDYRTYFSARSKLAHRFSSIKQEKMLADCDIQRKE